jgi:hypothetical protein
MAPPKNVAATTFGSIWNDNIAAAAEKIQAATVVKKV